MMVQGYGLNEYVFHVSRVDTGRLTIHILFVSCIKILNVFMGCDLRVQPAGLPMLLPAIAHRSGHIQKVYRKR